MRRYVPPSRRVKSWLVVELALTFWAFTVLPAHAGEDAAPAPHGGEYVEWTGAVDDTTFYRMVACGAPPGGTCLKPETRWPAATAMTLTVAVARVHPAFPSYKRAMVDEALTAAVAEINASGAAVSVTLLPEGARGDIPVFLTGAARGTAIRDTGFRGLDGTPIQAGLVTLWWRDGIIESAGIALSRDVRRRSIRSVVLEELVQSLGLATDIRNPAYAGRSVFDEDSNAVFTLVGQDAEALRRHYPPEGAPASVGHIRSASD